MRSYYLKRMPSDHGARNLLSAILSGQTDPWLVLAPDGDPIAYVNLHKSDELVSNQYLSEDFSGLFEIHADVSGRHYNEDKLVLGVLYQLQKKLGGEIVDDDDQVLWFQSPPDASSVK